MHTSFPSTVLSTNLHTGSRVDAYWGRKVNEIRCFICWEIYNFGFLRLISKREKKKESDNIWKSHNFVLWNFETDNPRTVNLMFLWILYCTGLSKSNRIKSYYFIYINYNLKNIASAHGTKIRTLNK